MINLDEVLDSSQVIIEVTNPIEAGLKKEAEEIKGELDKHLKATYSNLNNEPHLLLKYITEEMQRADSQLKKQLLASVKANLAAAINLTAAKSMGTTATT